MGLNLPGIGVDGRLLRPLKCCRCQESLFDAHHTDTCLICQTPVIQTIYQQFTLLDDQGCLTSDLPCGSCKYNLRTMHYAKPCPECGMPVSQTIIQNRLLMADAQWIKQMRLAYLLIGLGILFILPAIVVPLGFVVTLIMGLVGVWKVSSPDVFTDQMPVNQKVCSWLKRCCQLSLIIPAIWVTLAIVYVVIAINTATGISASLRDTINLSIWILLALCWAVTGWLYYKRCLLLSTHLNHPKLERDIGFTRGLYLLTILFTVAVTLFQVMPTQNDLLAVAVALAVFVLLVATFVANAGVAFRMYWQFDKLTRQINSMRTLPPHTPGQTPPTQPPTPVS
ncbi:MAG: hypothetical protein ACF8OB_13290 [Phycisphaeraceae bacterium JB051]